jgi:NAD(P)-dependent dehydrogenase (short-subunit alcohol dehydrogenase family)
MTAQKRGSIINISSTYGHEGAAYASVYAASKHAVEGLTKSAALEVASTGVRVNAVAPGPTDTGMLDRFTGTPENKTTLIGSVPLGRIGKPDDIANAVLFLAADASSVVTGRIVTVDGQLVDLPAAPAECSRLATPVPGALRRPRIAISVRPMSMSGNRHDQCINHHSEFAYD